MQQIQWVVIFCDVLVSFILRFFNLSSAQYDNIFLRTISSENGIWCAWKEWSECSAPCGIGKKSRQRECNCPAPQFGGQICKGESAVEADCFEKNCASKYKS